MRKHLTKLGLISSALAVALISGSVAFALPPQANVHAQTANTSGNASSGAGQAAEHKPATTGQASGQSHLATAQLTACQNRENAINNIMSRIDTRAQNQLTLFSTIATRVENFYTSKGKTVGNFSQLTDAIASAKTQAQTDLATMQANSSFSCDSNDPKGMAATFQAYLKTEITDLQNYRTAVKNLIVAVAKANGATVTDSSQTTTQGGQQ